LLLHNQTFDYETGHGWYFNIPDTGESNNESRQMATISYRGKISDTLSHDYSLGYGRHSLQHNLRLYGNGAYENWYPAGVSEYLETHFQDVFARAQMTWQPVDKFTVLGGAEYAAFLYNGDAKHYSNVDLLDAEGGYPPLDGPRQLGPYYEWILNKPVHNIGVYAQGATGKILNNLLSITAGLRFDSQMFNFTDLAQAERPDGFKSFQQLSPRLAIVGHPLQNLSVKALAGRAFRAPAPVELFGANTWIVGSNLHELRPEIITTYEVAGDWQINPALNWRANAYHTTFENQIAYGTGLVLTNYYTRNNVGVETELLFGQELAGVGRFTGFANYSFVHMLRETILDPTFEASANLTWAPVHSAKAGVAFRRGELAASLQALYQGEVLRRASDRATEAYLPLRPDVVPAFVTLDATIHYDVFSWMKLGVVATNLLNTRATLVKGGDYPFDYQMESRRVFGTATFALK
jgi:outer membrane receptor protein involved in Fe transport